MLGLLLVRPIARGRRRKIGLARAVKSDGSPGETSLLVASLLASASDSVLGFAGLPGARRRHRRLVMRRAGAGRGSPADEERCALALIGRAEMALARRRRL
ncbi:hypothetical protein ACVOMV_08080 [Mesorhizobium atlanticum]